MQLKVLACISLLFLWNKSVIAQTIEYSETTGKEEQRLKVQITSLSNGKEIIFTDANTYAHHVFVPDGSTQSWTHRDKKEQHEFKAVRKGNLIEINGIFKGKPIGKTVKVDEKPWINKLDHGLSAWAVTDTEETELIFWTLKLSSDLDPILFRAEKEGQETIYIENKTFEAIKVKISLDGLLLSKLWSAHCWYEANSGLFLKFEGTQGGPGSPLTTILMNEVVSP